MIVSTHVSLETLIPMHSLNTNNRVFINLTNPYNVHSLSCKYINLDLQSTPLKTCIHRCQSYKPYMIHMYIYKMVMKGVQCISYRCRYLLSDSVTAQYYQKE
uniref:Uncharacterized protein n=1 Tax=Setaria italica TaxID=4555 RepID=K3XNI7_SETIT